MKKTTTCIQAAAIAASALALASTAKGDSSVYALNVSGNQSSLSTASHWTNQDDGTTAPHAPNSQLASSTDFIVTNRFELRTMSAVSSVYGHLTVGAENSAGIILNKVYGKTVQYESGLVCVNGIYNAINQSSAGETSRARIGGSIIIASPETSPFLFGNQTGNGVTISADVSGAIGTKFVMGAGYDGSGSMNSTDIRGEPMILSGDNSAFLGKIEVSSSGNATLALGSDTALGGARDSFSADTVKITTKNIGTLVFTNGAPTKIDTANLGITFNGMGGGSFAHERTLVFYVMEGLNTELAVPVEAYARGKFNDRSWLDVKKTGAGTLTWSGDFSTPNGIASGHKRFFVEEGRIILASSSTIALTNELSSAVWLKTPGTADTALSKWTFSAGGALVLDATGGKTPGAFVLDSSASISDTALPLPVHLEMDDAKADCDICFLKVPTSARTLSEADFIDTNAPARKTSRFRIAIEGGMQSVSLVRGNHPTILSIR